MNTKPSTENHFFVAHRDDVWLTFGGLILLKKYSSEKNIVHLLYGLDGYMIEDFKKKLIKKDPFIITYLRKLSIISGSEILFKEIIECLNRYNKDDNTFLGVNVRRLEEKSIAVRNDVILNEYMIPCGYPMRGYKTFNADQTSIFHDDINQQLRLLYDNSCSKSYYNKLKKIAKKNYVDLSDLPSIKDLINKFDKDKIYNLFFLSGIGGHPDHIIISKLAYIIKEKFGDKLNVYLGQDLPYATVSEWFQTSKVELTSIEKEYICIDSVVKEKFSILRNSYKSQLTAEDVRVIKYYTGSVLKRLNKDYLQSIDIKYSINKQNIKNIEVLYKL